jgi:hypothetical protein
MRTERREAPAPPRPAPDAERLQAVTEALDRLLDPLEDVAPESSSVEERAPAEAWPPPEPLVLVYENEGGRVRDFAARMRWSQRGRFRIPRFLARWALVAGAFWGVLWLIFSTGALR